MKILNINTMQERVANTDWDGIIDAVSIFKNNNYLRNNYIVTINNSKQFYPAKELKIKTNSFKHLIFSINYFLIIVGI